MILLDNPVLTATSLLSVRLDGEGEVHCDAADGLPEEQRDHPRGGHRQDKQKVRVVSWQTYHHN